MENYYNYIKVLEELLKIKSVISIEEGHHIYFLNENKTEMIITRKSCEMLFTITYKEKQVHLTLKHIQEELIKEQLIKACALLGWLV